LGATNSNYYIYLNFIINSLSQLNSKFKSFKDSVRNIYFKENCTLSNWFKLSSYIKELNCTLILKKDQFLIKKNTNNNIIFWNLSEDKFISKQTFDEHKNKAINNLKLFKNMVLYESQNLFIKECTEDWIGKSNMNILNKCLAPQLNNNTNFEKMTFLNIRSSCQIDNLFTSYPSLCKFCNAPKIIKHTYLKCSKVFKFK
jgi:hypothetical protein